MAERAAWELVKNLPGQAQYKPLPRSSVLRDERGSHFWVLVRIGSIADKLLGFDRMLLSG